jgi:mono/diheme cytochrome c family protein
MTKRLALLSAVSLLLSVSAAAAADGAAIFKAQCAKCHGDSGKSDTAVGKAMKVPPLAGDAKVQQMSDADVVARISGNAKHPAGVKGLSPDDLNAVAGYVKQLAGK